MGASTLRKRYSTDFVTEAKYPVPVVTDRRLPKRDQVLAFCRSVTAAKRIAVALNAIEQRRLFEQGEARSD